MLVWEDMFRMNNRGQSLIAFVLIVPIILLLILMVYDISSMVLLKKELNDINYLTLDYAINHMDDESIYDKLHEIISKNKMDIDEVNIQIEDDKVFITLKDNINNKLSLINKVRIFDIESAYVGYLDNGKKIIEKNK